MGYAVAEIIVETTLMPATHRSLSTAWRSHAAIVCVLVVGWVGRSTLGADPKELFFAKHVRPLLAEKCWACHGDDAKQLKGELDLKTRVAALKRIGATGASPAPEIAKPIIAIHGLAETRTTVMATAATLAPARSSARSE